MSNEEITMTLGDYGEFRVAAPFTNRELHLIKQIADVRAGELFEALDRGDNDVLVALAHIAVKRTGGQQPSLDRLWDMPAGDITLVLPDDSEPDPTAAANGNREMTPDSSGGSNTESTSTSAPAT